MKLTFTFIVTSFVVTSLMGQAEKAKIEEFGKIHQHDRNISDFENPNGVRAIHRSLKDYPFKPNVSILKSTKTSIQLLDSTIDESIVTTTGEMVLSHKHEITYDSKEKVTLEICYNWNKLTNLWMGESKDEYMYDSNGRKTLKISCSYNKSKNSWIRDSKYEYAFNSNGNLNYYIFYIWDESSGNWIGEGKYEYSYATNGTRIQYVYSNGDKITNKWGLNSKNEFTYNSNGNITLNTLYRWDKFTGMWILSNKDEYAYDANGNETQFIEYSRNLENTDWIGIWKYDYTFDSNANITFFNAYSWDLVNNTWVNWSKDESKYDSNGNEILFSNYYWDVDNSSWMISWQIESTYDANNNLAFYIQKDSWDNSIDNWSNISRTEYTFNNTTNFLSSSKTYTQEVNSDHWELTGQTTNYYADHEVTGIRNGLNVDLKIYPNPFTNGFLVSGLAGVSTIRLSDINGKVLFSKEITNDEYVIANTLTPGIYLVDINTGNSHIEKKLVKK